MIMTFVSIQCDYKYPKGICENCTDEFDEEKEAIEWIRSNNWSIVFHNGREYHFCPEHSATFVGLNVGAQELKQQSTEQDT